MLTAKFVLCFLSPLSLQHVYSALKLNKVASHNTSTDDGDKPEKVYKYDDRDGLSVSDWFSGSGDRKFGGRLVNFLFNKTIKEQIVTDNFYLFEHKIRYLVYIDICKDPHSILK